MKFLIVDDEKELRDKIVRLCKVEDIDAISAENGLSAQRMLEGEPVDAVITDLNMPGVDGIGLLTWMREHTPTIPVIMMSGFGEIADAVKAMKLGAQDYVVKPIDPEDFIDHVKRIVADHKLHLLIETGKQAPQEFQDWIGESQAMRDIKALIEQIAPTPATVLISGESGTGKEVVARMIHRLSPRAEQSFIAINLGGVPETLLESELFGYEKGAFTGAVARKIGMFELASSGTLFLDEIADVPLHLQVKLLRVLQEREIQRLGGTQNIPIDVRIVAATNQPIEERIKQGLFREDLYYRLNIIQIHLPPLRDRREDLPALIGFFIQKFSQKIGKPVASIEPDALNALQNHKFPGNIRELENILERAVIFAKTTTITLYDLGLTSASTKPYRTKGTLEDIEREVIRNALARWEGNRSRAADELGINRKTLLNKIKEYGLE